MLFLFRKLRNQMVQKNSGDSSPVLRYVLYAIGEIVLVVIGILIAVQIGDWNTQKQEEKLAKVYLTSLRQDLEDQLLTINKQLDFEIKMMEMCRDMRARYEENQRFTFDSLLANQLFIIGSRKTFTSRSTTYSEMISSGNLTLIRDLKLKNKILIYYQEADRITNVMRANNLMIDSTFPPKTIRYSFATSGFNSTDVLTNEGISPYLKENLMHFNFSKLYKKGQMMVQNPENELELIGLISYRCSIESIHITLLEKFAESTRKMKEVIEGSLKS